MYYVLYSPNRKMYVSDKGQQFSSYNNATKFNAYGDALSECFDLHDNYPDVKVIGPCQEGEEP